MKQARALISDNHRINQDEDGTFAFYAKLAARNERTGSVTTAEALWLKAKRRAENKKDRDWADIRASICSNRHQKWDACINRLKRSEASV